jgi:hypothetical protein
MWLTTQSLTPELTLRLNFGSDMQALECVLHDNGAHLPFVLGALFVFRAVHPVSLQGVADFDCEAKDFCHCLQQSVYSSLCCKICYN